MEKEREKRIALPTSARSLLRVGGVAIAFGQHAAEPAVGGSI